MKLISKFAVGIPTASVGAPLGYIWKLTRTYILRPEILIFSLILFIIFIYLQAVDAWSRTLFDRIQHTLGCTTSKVNLRTIL